MSEDLLIFFKALSEPNRLKIVGLLAQRPYSGEELAALLGLKASTVSHHLSRLVKAGLVSARAEGYYNVYQLERGALEAKSRALFSSEDLSAVVINVDLDAYDQKVVKDYTGRNGRLTTIPSQRKKLEAVMRYVAAAFEVGRDYSEDQVNEILKRYYEDTATLRRELVGYGLMKREGGGRKYWREK